jgi:hypothetical protein
LAKLLLYDQLCESHAEAFKAPITSYPNACSIQEHGTFLFS